MAKTHWYYSSVERGREEEEVMWRNDRLVERVAPIRIKNTVGEYWEVVLAGFVAK